MKYLQKCYNSFTCYHVPSSAWVECDNDVFKFCYIFVNILFYSNAALALVVGNKSC